MDIQDKTSQAGSSINSGAGSWPPTRADPDVFEEVFGGPCWTESCPTPKNCFHCLVCASKNELQVVGPPTCSYCRPCENANPAPTTIPVIALRPPTPTISSKSLSPILMTSPAKHTHVSLANLQIPPSLTMIDDEIQSEFEHIELKSTVRDTCDNSYTSLDQIKILANTEGLGDAKQYYLQDFRPASVTPTNLSPLPKRPTCIFSVCESEESPYFWPDFSVSVDDIALGQHFDFPRIGGMQRKWNSAPRLKHASIMPCNSLIDFPTPLPTPPPPCFLQNRQKDSGEFVRPRIAALEPYCTCIKDHPILSAEIRPVPWVHTHNCKIIRALYESRSLFYEKPLREIDYEALTSNSLMWHMTDEVTARTCLRVTMQPNVQPVVQFFAQYTGFLGVHLTPDQDYAFVAYATDEQSNRARLALEGLLVSQLQKIRITTVDMEQALREIRGKRISVFKDYLSRFICCKKPKTN